VESSTSAQRSIPVCQPQQQQHQQHEWIAQNSIRKPFASADLVRNRQQKSQDNARRPPLISSANVNEALLLARLVGQYCFARWRLSSVVCRRL